jgi:hypothetical protein
MSKKDRIYTQREWDDADPLDRLYIHLMEPDRWVLSAPEEDKMDALTTTWKIIVKKASPRERIRLITRSLDCTERTAYRYIQDATKLFMETLDLDHELELRLAYHRFSRIHDEARTDKDWDGARRALDSAMNIRAQIESRQPVKVKSYARLIVVDDPKAIRARNQDNDVLEFEMLGNGLPNLSEQKTEVILQGD